MCQGVSALGLPQPRTLDCYTAQRRGSTTADAPACPAGECRFDSGPCRFRPPAGGFATMPGEHRKRCFLASLGPGRQFVRERMWCPPQGGPVRAWAAPCRSHRIVFVRAGDGGIGRRLRSLPSRAPTLLAEAISVVGVSGRRLMTQLEPLARASAHCPSFPDLSARSPRSSSRLEVSREPLQARTLRSFFFVRGGAFLTMDQMRNGQLLPDRLHPHLDAFCTGVLINC